MLSQRLSTIRSYFRGQSIVWDVGCDHGQLGLSFAHEPAVQEIHLVDPSRPVVDLLFQHLKDSYITIPAIKINVHHMQGQNILLSTKNNIIFIAGMGGKEIQEIVHQLIPQLTDSDQIVISPHRKILELRSYLNASKLRLIDEQVLFEDGQFYQVMCLSIKDSLPRVAPFGDKLWFGHIGERYRQQQISAFSQHQDKLSEGYVSYLKSRDL